MERKAVSGIMLTLLLIGMLTLAFNVQPVRAEPKTWTVDDDGPADFSRIGDAIGSPSVMDGDTIFVYSGTYYERYLYVSKSLTIIGENKSTTIIDGSGGGPIIALYWVTGASLSGFTIRDGSWNLWNVVGSGILLHTARSCSVSDTIVSNSAYGITVYRSRGNTVSGNTISDTEIGIELESSNNNTIVSNVISNSTLGDPFNWGGGIYLEYSSNNTVADNTISNTTEVGILVHQYSYRNTIVGNVISRNTEIEIEDSFGISLGENTYENTVLDNVISKSHRGIYTAQLSYNNTIIGNTISNLTIYAAGINIWGPNNRIIRNTITNMGYVGIQLNSISSDSGYGVPNACANNVVSENTVSNSTFGINLILAAFSNTIAGNNVSNNGLGILIGDSNNNTIIENFVSNNDYGILLFSSNNTKVYHNNFIDNTKQVLLSQSFNTIWDDGYPSGGNYWSDYLGVDADGDGIGDTPYVIDANNRDRYPLMNPWTPTITATVDIDPDTLNLKSKGQWITAYIQLPVGYSPEDIDVTTILLNGTIQPVLDPMYDFVTNSSEYIVDHDSDGVSERMVKFNRTEVASWVCIDLGIEYGNVTLAITGELFDGTPFEGTDTIKVLFPGDVDGDGYVGSADAGVLNGAYGTSSGNPLYVPEADFDEDGYIGSADAGIVNGNYGKTAV